MRPILCLVAFFVAGLLWGQSTPDEILLSYRENSALSVPRWDANLAHSARNRASVLAQSGTLSHFDDQGRGPGLQMVSEGLPLGEYGEVLGAGSSFSSVWATWLNSPPHLAVLRTKAWTNWGWGSSERSGVTVWVLRFWRP